MTPLSIPPTRCGCGITHTVATPGYRITESGVWFNCGCKSTNLVSTERMAFHEAAKRMEGKRANG